MSHSCENYDTSNPTVLTIEGVYKHGENQALNVSRQVVFRNVVRDNSGNITSQDIIPIQRNHLYKVILTPKYNNGALVFGEMDYAIQVNDWQTGETLVFAGDANLTAQSTPSFTVTNAVGIFTTEADGVTNPTTVYTNINEHTIYLTVTSSTTGTMLECPEFNSTKYGLDASKTTNDANGNLVETYWITIDDDVALATDYTFTLSNAINTSLAKTFILRKAPLISNVNDIQIGDVYYACGLWSRVSNKSICNEVSSPIGVVVYVSDNSTDGNKAAEKDTKATGIGGHALVMALYNASTGVTWESSNYDHTTSPFLTNVSTRANAMTDYDGYLKTKQMATKTGQCSTHTHNAATVAWNYAPAGVTDNSYKAKSTGWFLPSIGQWMKVALAMGGTVNEPRSDGTGRPQEKLSQYVLAAGGNNSGIYQCADGWSSSEMSSTNAANVHWHDSSGAGFHWGNQITKSYTNYVRAFLAF